MTECSVCFDLSDENYLLKTCNCQFCNRCVLEYLRVRVLSGDVIYIPCLSAQCKQAFTHEEVTELLEDSDLLEKYLKYKGNREVERDPNRTFCPNPLCSCICEVPPGPASLSVDQKSTALSQSANPSSSNAQTPQSTIAATPRPVLCSQCGFLFCSLCHAQWNGGDQAGSGQSGVDSPQSHHPFMSTTAASSIQTAIPMGNLLFNGDMTQPNGSSAPHQCEVTYVVNRQRWNLLSRIGIDVAADDVMIKRCPCCGIPVERGPGCAQMLCLNCHHTFCWYCLTVLDGDVFLRHYESGVCRARLGHTPGDLRRHRARVAMALTCCGVVAVLLLPVIIVCSPCILTCVCCVRSLMNNSARNNNAGSAGGNSANSQQQRHLTRLSSVGSPKDPADAVPEASRKDNTNNSPV